jgi:hypothetical protein
MFDQEEVQYQIFKQTAMGQAPGSPNGILVPKGNGFQTKYARNRVDNPSIFSDGFKRRPARGNHTTTASGPVVGNLNHLPHLLAALGSQVSSAFDGVYDVTVTNGGSGYTSVPTVSFTGGTGGSGAAGVAVVENGSVIGIIMTNRGSGYTGAPTIGFTGGGGTGAAATANLAAGKFKHIHKVTRGTPVLYLIEKGIVGSTLWRRYYDMVLRKLGFTFPLEGMCEVSTDFGGSGKFEKKTTSLDGTPTEVTGEPIEYSRLALVQGGVASTIISELSLDLDLALREKRAHNGQGRATELRRGRSAITGSITGYYENETFLALGEDGTLTSLLGNLATTDGLIDIDAPKVWVGVTDYEDGEEGATFTADIEVVKDGASEPLTITVINGTASY